MKKFFLPGKKSSKKSKSRGRSTDHTTVEEEGRSVNSSHDMMKKGSGGSGAASSSEFKSKAPDQTWKASMESPHYHEQDPESTVTEEAPSDHIVEEKPTNYEHYNSYINAPHTMEDDMGPAIFQKAVTDWINFPWDHQDNVGGDHDHGNSSRGFGYN